MSPSDTPPTEDNPPADALDRYLLSGRAPPDAQSRAGIDGVLAAALLAPDPLPRAAWDPVIWGDDPPVFADREEADAVESALLARFAAMADLLGERRTRHRFTPDFGARADTAAAGRDWALGFLDAVALQRAAWEPMARNRRAGNLLPLLTDFAFPPDKVPPELAADLADPTLILGMIAAQIADYWESVAAARPGPAKTGRNDPCPCGSGKKFKRCCGQG